MPEGDVVMRIAADGRVIEWSARAQEAFGWSPQEAAASSLGALMRHIGTADTSSALPAALGPVTVRPVLSDALMVWEVRASAADSPSGRDLAVLRALFTHSPVDLHILDEDLRIIRVNDDARGSHHPAGSLLGGVFPGAFGLAAPDVEATAARRVLETGEPALRRVVRSTPDPGSSRRRIYSISYVRLEDEGGEVLGLVASALDVTDSERAIQRLRVLEEVRRRVGGLLEVMAVCQELADAVVPAFTGIVVVEVIEDVVRGEDPPLAPVDRHVPLRRAAFRGQVSAHPVGEARRLPEGTPFSRVLSDLRPRLVPIERDSLWLSADPARAEAIRESAAHSLIVAPLTVRGQALGVVSFYRHMDEEPFDEDDIALTSDVCAHAALCIENARRYTRERTISATLKRRLLPQRPTTPSTVDIAHLHIPGPGGGGAWFDVIELAGARTALILGDVAGRGLVTATTMGQLRTVIHSLAALDLEPDELMARLGDTAARLAAERASLPLGDPLNQEPLTASCLIAVYDAVNQMCTVVRAGLAEPYVVLTNGNSMLMPVPAGPVLAGADHAPFPATTFPLPADSMLAVSNEGLLETSAQLRSLLDAGADRPLDDVCDTVAYAMRDRNEREMMLLLARTKALPADRVLTLPLPAEPQAASMAREASRAQLEAWNIDEEVAFTTQLIVSELVSNAVRYGAPPIRLRLILDKRLTVEVGDTANSAPHLKHARTIDEDGRGLFIVASIADDWGTRYVPDGKTVWAQLLADTTSTDLQRLGGARERSR
ncbi:SpoIIE family protein phosphatase [Streptomyces sp. NBC_01497]|uniref:SpoIIE family protein phosphatase n=1 Tax=Streptomyces sp. NBC_01497 TaxID=2903885 RepID=UPI002E316282|nr:SpoIIE family protein phosphatase [Streptomyces sp. NBC_01497]